MAEIYTVYVLEQNNQVAGIFATLNGAKAAVQPAEWVIAEFDTWTNINLDGPRSFIIPWFVRP